MSSDNQDHSPSEEAAAPEGKKKRGRPKGRKTQPKPVVDTVLAVCPSCGKSGATIRSGAKPRVTTHKQVIDGVEYNAVRWDVVQCNHCPQRFTRRSIFNN